jgi:signal transduction histidine kinase
MNFFARTGWIKITLIGLLILLGAGSLVYNQYLVGKLLEQERISVELWAKAVEFNALPVHQQATTKLLSTASQLQQNPEVPDSLVEALFEIESMRSSQDFVTDELIIDESQNFKIPAVMVDSNDTPQESRYMVQDTTEESGFREVIDYGFKNVPERDIDTPEERQRLVQKFKDTNPPIKIVLGDENRRIPQYVYYGESPTVRLLRYFPYIQIIILSLLLGIGYTTYKSITRVEQSNLWVGMAKEAAHQLGTPISSLFGWIQLFRDEYEDDENAERIISEIENDVNRLSGVAERFGKIGSSPELKETDIRASLEEVVSYMERRLPRLGKAVEVRKSLNAEASVNLNPELFQWAIENLVKNALDALKSNTEDSYISVASRVSENEVIIDIEDSGAGIESKYVKSIFRPGFSTKKRGWGLGLSLTKRIIEEYHGGRIYVVHSELGIGTTIRITLPVVKRG